MATPTHLLAAAAKPTLVVATPSGTGYFYDLLRHWGASDLTAKTGQLLIARPLEILLIITGTWVLARVGSRLAGRLLSRVATRVATGAGSDRTRARIETVGHTVARLWKAVIWVVGGLMVLGTVGINLAPLLAGATVVGAAIGFGAQSIIRDILSGFFLVIEDQFGVGDTISVGDLRGTVEDFHLRVTRLRGPDGTVWYVPNGEIRRLGNASLEGSAALVDFRIPLATDVASAVESVSGAVALFADDPGVAPWLSGSPTVVGIVDADDAAATVRVTVPTTPEGSASASTALRAVVLARLHSDGIIPASS